LAACPSWWGVPARNGMRLGSTDSFCFLGSSRWIRVVLGPRHDYALPGHCPGFHLHIVGRRSGRVFQSESETLKVLARTMVQSLDEGEKAVSGYQ